MLVRVPRSVAVISKDTSNTQPTSTAALSPAIMPSSPLSVSGLKPIKINFHLLTAGLPEMQASGSSLPVGIPVSFSRRMTFTRIH